MNKCYTSFVYLLNITNNICEEFVLNLKLFEHYDHVMKEYLILLVYFVYFYYLNSIYMSIYDLEVVQTFVMILSNIN